ncbi:unnamed protein product [Nezara viridula]|uniref:Uncharacterized protein n=1 Tax=Nezara viridula TaxID=85310 RepID=A0A9P0MMQ7_NEZVI|nr:unnamed protein product [Nezara viridula]
MKRKKIKLEIGGGNSCRPNGQPLLTPIRHRGNSRRQPFLTPFRRELKKIQRKIEASRLDEEDGWMEKKNRTLIEMEMDHVRQKQLLQLQFINQKRELELALEEETEKRDMIFIKQLLTLMQEATEKESSLKQELMEARREQLLKENIMRMRELVKSEIELENLD